MKIVCSGVYLVVMSPLILLGCVLAFVLHGLLSGFDLGNQAAEGFDRWRLDESSGSVSVTPDDGAPVSFRVAGLD